MPKLLEKTRNNPVIELKTESQKPIHNSIHYVSFEDLKQEFFKNESDQIESHFNELATNPQTIKIIEQGIVDANTAPYKKTLEKFEADFQPPKNIDFFEFRVGDYNENGEPQVSSMLFDKSPYIAKAFSCIQ